MRPGRGAAVFVELYVLILSLYCFRLVQVLTFSTVLVALDAGCQQQPAPGTPLGVNDTVFSLFPVVIVDHSAPVDTYTPSGLTTAQIAGIASGSAALLLLSAGCIFMAVRRRRNRARRAARISAMSFRCQTHVTPRTPHFPEMVKDEPTERPYVDPAAALSSNPVVGAWPLRPGRLDTAAGIAAPRPTHASPQMTSPGEFETPTSSVSAQSGAPLLGMSPRSPFRQQFASPGGDDRGRAWSRELVKSKNTGPAPMGIGITTRFPPPPTSPR